MTKRRKIIIAAPIIVVAGVAIWALVPVQPVGLNVTISLDSAEFREGDQILLRATITNDSEKPVRILEPSLADMTFEVALFDANDVRYDYLGLSSIKQMEKNAGHYLHPGETIRLEIPLEEFFELPTGQYRVVAAYRTLNYPDVNVVFCRIPSNEVVFQLLPSE